jgi:F-type H+-transporting ATPase subunit delta
MNRETVISIAAKRYARALLQVSIKQRNFTRILEQLERFSDQLQHISMLHELFLNPAIPVDKKRKILEDVGKIMKLEPLALNFLGTVIRRNRLQLLDQIIASSEQQFLEGQGIIVVEVTSARKLAPEEESKLAQRIEEFTGKKVQLENRVEPGLLGGAITRIGSTLYDGSIQAHLEQIRHRITQS